MSRAAVKVGGGGSAVVGRVGPRERREGRRESGREEGREGERGEERIGESTHTSLLPALPPPDYVPIKTPQGRHLHCSLLLLLSLPGRTPRSRPSCSQASTRGRSRQHQADASSPSRPLPPWPRGRSQHLSRGRGTDNASNRPSTAAWGFSCAPLWQGASLALVRSMVADEGSRGQQPRRVGGTPPRSIRAPRWPHATQPGRKCLPRRCSGRVEGRTWLG